MRIKHKWSVGRSIWRPRRVDDSALWIHRNCILQALNIYSVINLELEMEIKLIIIILITTINLFIHLYYLWMCGYVHLNELKSSPYQLIPAFHSNVWISVPLFQVTTHFVYFTIPTDNGQFDAYYGHFNGNSVCPSGMWPSRRKINASAK